MTRDVKDVRETDVPTLNPFGTAKLKPSTTRPANDLFAALRKRIRAVAARARPSLRG
jgi:hypothetical protein